VVLFGGTFEESSDSKSKVVIKLLYNGVRKARAKAKIGFIHPSRLMRPLSVSSLHPGSSLPSFASLMLFRWRPHFLARIRSARSLASLQQDLCPSIKL
jgi:hypothetical protein